MDVISLSQEACTYTKHLHYSTIAENQTYPMEGLVLKTPLGLLSRSGERLITKIKNVDWINPILNQA